MPFTAPNTRTLCWRAERRRPLAVTEKTRTGDTLATPPNRLGKPEPFHGVARPILEAALSAYRLWLLCDAGLSLLRAVASHAKQPTPKLIGELAEWLRSGLQIRVHRFDSGTRLQTFHRISTDREAETSACYTACRTCPFCLRSATGQFFLLFVPRSRTLKATSDVRHLRPL